MAENIDVSSLSELSPSRASSLRDSTEAAQDIKSSAKDRAARIDSVEDNSVEIARDTFSVDRVKQMLERLEAALPSTSKSLHFQVDEVLNRPVITVVDKDSGEILRKLPSDEVIRVAHNIDKMKGIIFDDKN